MDRIDRAAECEDEESRVVASQYQDVPSDVVDSDDEAEALFGWDGTQDTNNNWSK